MFGNVTAGMRPGVLTTSPFAADRARVFKSQYRSQERCENDAPLSALWRGIDY